ncbi:MAG TPA: choice-of-anchor tandem repeat NxxGxxAF-containing protein [Gemmataceae bacterium]|nr:choice-of-anchor tandem repeat NxxGxxAF-containing protein [Gemmataceae bacterium]
MAFTVSRQRTQRRQTRQAVLRVEQLEARSLLSGFSITPVAILGNPAPGPEGGTFTFDFEAGGLNNKGQVVFAADLNEGAGDIGEGIFVGGKGGLSQVFRIGEPAPGGGTFGGFGSFSPNSINDAGDAAVGFGLDPLGLPFGTNAGVYRYDHSSGSVTAVLIPGVTPIPGGGTFQGTGFHVSINNAGAIVFPGLVPADIGPGAAIGLGTGIFLANKHGDITKIVRPGDAAPGGSVFDFAENPAINPGGDIGFGAHIAADPRIGLGQELPVWIFSAESVYFRDGQTGAIRSIAHQGASIPASAGGGTFDYAYAPEVNSRGQVLFDAALRGTSIIFNGAPQDSQALFLWSDGNLISIARQGDALPGGGHVVSTSINSGNYSINERGDVAFSVLLDNGDEGVYLWSHGALTLVAKTGTQIPGVGTIAGLDQYGTGLPNGYVDLNARGQIAFAAVLTNGGGALLLATPGDNGNSGPTMSATRTPPTVVFPAWLNLSRIVVSPPAESSSILQAANSGSTSAMGMPVFLQQVATFTVPQPWNGEKSSRTSASDDFFATSVGRLWESFA